MEETETCGHCNQWEEKIYWNRFQKIHFYLILVGDFANEMAIPKKFANFLQEKLPEPSNDSVWATTVTLKGPSGATWNVDIVSRGENLFFKHGWKDFVSRHSLEENDLLVFKYNGDTCLDVLVFDHRSSCEKEASYFIKKCGHKEISNEMTKDGSVEITEAKFDDGIGSSSKKPRVDEYVVPTPFVRCKKSRIVADGSEPVSTKRKIRKKEPFTGTPDEKEAGGGEPVPPVSTKRKIKKKEPFTGTPDEKGNHDAEQKGSSGGRGYQLMYMSGRRPISDSEKEKALQLAQSSLSSTGFIVIMRPTHVYKRFFVSIPSEWASIHMTPENQEVLLLHNEKTWRARFYHDKIRHCGGLAGAWKYFAIENNLEVFDVCKFEFVNQSSTPISLNVTIFRVVEELTPLMRITSAVPLRQKAAGEP